MAINFSSWSIRHPLPPIVVAGALIMLGLISFNRLPITRMPNVDAPVISVTVMQFGAAPAELESKVTKNIEDAISSVPGVRHINSLISDGMSTTTIVFNLETNTDRAINDDPHLCRHRAGKNT
jgi:multidrug efflux pump subunit AcrB